MGRGVVEMQKIEAYNVFPSRKIIVESGGKDPTSQGVGTMGRSLAANHTWSI